MSLPVVSVTARGRPVVVVSPGERSVVASVRVPGEQGPPGPSGAAYDHLQTQASVLWTIAHNRGVRPSVATFSVGGVEIEGSVRHLSDDVVQVAFNIPVAGYARLT